MNRGIILVGDYGTTSLKVSLFDEDLNIIDKINIELTYEYPREGYIEFEAEKYWSMFLEAAKTLINRNNSYDTLEAISITSQAETLIPIEKNCKPLRKAIVWLDERAKDESKQLREEISAHVFYYHTGLSSIDPILPITKILWIKKYENEIYQNTYKFLLLKDFVINRLTGEIASDYSVASCSGYFDIRKKTWWRDILEITNIDIQKLPEVKEPNYFIGYLKKELSSILGIKRKVKVMTGMLDQCGAAIGAGNIEKGILTETTGTAMVIALTINSLEELNLEDTVPVVCHAIPSKYLILPYAPTAGIILKWFKDNFCSEEIYLAKIQQREVYQVIDEIVEKNKTIRPKLIVLPYFCGTVTPINDPELKGAIVGLDLKTNKSDIMKAIMESIGFMLKEHIDYLESKGFRITKIISLGGGAKSNIWLQIKSDILGREILSIENEEPTSFGCALTTALNLGFISDLNGLARKIKIKCSFLPNTANTKPYSEKYNLYRKFLKALLSSPHNLPD